MLKTRFVIVIAAAGPASCGGEGEVRTVTVPAEAQETATPAPARTVPVLIETRIPDARNHKGRVASGSALGEKPFCKDGKTTGGSDGPTITTTFDCPGGTLTIHYAPAQRSFVQGSPWEIESGTGDFEGLEGGGSMIARFGEDDSGREVFTGLMSG